MKSILYVSYDGMTDPLGQSQVIPYLIGLSAKGYKIHILSAEKSETFNQRNEHILNLLKQYDISWHYIKYTKKPAVISTIKDIYTLNKKAKSLYRKFNFDIIHCRSYIAAFVGLKLKKNFNTKFLFDMRGFYADERVDGNLWKQSNLIFKFVYKYFKRKEKEFFSKADYTVSLTYAGKEIIQNKFNFQDIPIEVIPCCADLEHFNYHKLDSSKIEKFRKELALSENDFVLSYLGSVGTWYLLDEMLDFFKVLKLKYENSKFLFITHDNANQILFKSAEKGIKTEDIIIKPADREDIPEILSLSMASIFFIKPVFSKKASSPTKLAEILGLGIPIICNANVGDIDKFISENNIGVLISKMDVQSFEQAVENIDNIRKIDKASLRGVAEKLFSLNLGIKKYDIIYQKISRE